MKRTLTPIASGVALFLMGVAMSAQAQEAQPADAGVQTVVTTGIRASLQQALNVKKNAEQHVDVVTAEDIGKMPDKNVADSLSRVPGVTVMNSPAGGSGGFDERDRVGLRGTNPSLTQTLVDGHAIANGDWFVLDQSGSGVGRSVSYSLLPSELVSRVVVSKSAAASDIEGGTAGSVNIVTRKPLDFKKALTFEVGIGAVYANLPGKTDPQFSALGNFKNEANTFGLMAQVFAEKRSLRRDGVETLGYNKLDTTNAPALIAAHPDLDGVWAPDLIGAAYFTQQRKRTGGLLRAEFKPVQGLDVTLTGFSSKMNADNYNRNFMIAPRPGNINGATLSNYNIATDKNGAKTLTAAQFDYAAPSTIGYFDMISRNALASSNFLSLDASWKVNDALTLKLNTGVSNGKGRTDSQDVYEANINSDQAAYAFNGNTASPSFGFNGVNPSAGINNEPGTVANGMGFGWVFGVQNMVVSDKDTWGQVDGEYALNSGVLRSLTFGVRTAKHDRHTGSTVNQRPGCSTGTPYGAEMYNWGGAYNCTGGAAASSYAIANSPAFSQSYPSNFGNGFGVSIPNGIAYISPADLAAFDAKYTNRIDTASGVGAAVHSPIQGGEYGVKESTNALYVQGNLEGEGWSGNVGLRAVKTKQDSFAWSYSAQSATSVISAWGTEYLIPASQSYTNVLPSASVRLDVSKDVVARLSASRTLTRADYTALSSAVSLNTTGLFLGNTAIGSGTAGNPDLKPILSNNIDANLEWYFAPRAFVSVGAFHMGMGSYITDGSFSATYPALLTPSGGGASQLVNRTFTLTGPTNKKASVTGMEFAFEMPIAGNFGVNANYTLADGHDEDGHVLRGNVKNSYTVGGFFENDQFSARVNYSYTDDIFIGLDRGTDYYQKGTGVISASLGYKLNDNFSLSLDAQNLNNPKLKYYSTEDQPRGIYQNGRQFYLTAHLKF